jgi:hypothetical protein
MESKKHQESSEAKGGLDSKEYTDAVQKTVSTRKIIDELMQQKKLASPMLSNIQE